MFYYLIFYSNSLIKDLRKWLFEYLIYSKVIERIGETFLEKIIFQSSDVKFKETNFLKIFDSFFFYSLLVRVCTCTTQNYNFVPKLKAVS